MTAAPFTPAESVSLTVDGDATSCRESARRLRDLGHELQAAGATLERQRDLLPASLEGVAGTAYRDRAGRLGAAAAAFAARCGALGSALGRLAESLERSGRLLAAAREIGASHGLVLADRLVQPTSIDFAVPLPGELDAWERASAKVNEARTCEQVAQGAWREALRAYAEPFGSPIAPTPEWELPPRGSREHGPATGGKEPTPHRPPPVPHSPGTELPPLHGNPTPSHPESAGHAPPQPTEHTGRHGGGGEHGGGKYGGGKYGGPFGLVEVTPQEPVCREPKGISALPPGLWLPPTEPGPFVPTPVVPVVPPQVPVDPVDPIERGPRPFVPPEVPVDPVDPIERGPQPTPPIAPPVEPPVERAPLTPPDPGGLPPMHPTEGDAS